MHDALVGLLDKVDAAVAGSAGILDPIEVETVAAMARDTRMRLSYPESIVVVALAGGTGSGKSSLLNAVAGEEAALTGGIRPMTETPLALVPADGADALDGYLDDLGVTERVVHHGPDWLCLVDLPDNDSVEVAHRHRVDSLLPRVDMVVWVTDPEKYRDASLHTGYIAPMAGYQEQFIFVLNQVDRVGDADVGLIVADLEEALREDGILDPKVIATSANPVAGPPFGIETLLEALNEGVSRRGAVHQKALTDLAVASSRLVRSSAESRSVDFEKQWADEVGSAVDLARAGRAAGGGHDLAEYVQRLADEIGGETGDRLMDLALDTHAAFLECVAGAEPAAEKPRPWMARFRGEARADPVSSSDDLANAVDVRIGGPIRDLLVQRGRAHATITDLALALGDLERRLV